MYTSPGDAAAAQGHKRRRSDVVSDAAVTPIRMSNCCQQLVCLLCLTRNAEMNKDSCPLCARRGVRSMLRRSGGGTPDAPTLSLLRAIDTRMRAGSTREAAVAAVVPRDRGTAAAATARDGQVCADGDVRRDYERELLSVRLEALQAELSQLHMLMAATALPPAQSRDARERRAVLMAEIADAQQVLHIGAASAPPTNTAVDATEPDDGVTIIDVVDLSCSSTDSSGRSSSSRKPPKAAALAASADTLRRWLDSTDAASSTPLSATSIPVDSRPLASSAPQRMPTAPLRTDLRAFFSSTGKRRHDDREVCEILSSQSSVEL